MSSSSGTAPPHSSQPTTSATQDRRTTAPSLSPSATDKARIPSTSRPRSSLAPTASHSSSPRTRKVSTSSAHAKSASSPASQPAPNGTRPTAPRPSATAAPAAIPANRTPTKATKRDAAAAPTPPPPDAERQLDLDATQRVGFEPRGPQDPASAQKDAIVWLDIDNTLYKRSTRIAQLMGERIRAYFTGMGFGTEEARMLHEQYYKTYGLAIRGLVKHHEIDPLDYDKKCDASLPLEDILRPDPDIIRLLSDLDRTKVRVFALTNAYKQHADRVLRLLDLDDQVEGIVFCDYALPDFSCKPELDYYHAAMKLVGAGPATRCYFVDDSALNVVAAKELGWHSCVYFKEDDDDDQAGKGGSGGKAREPTDEDQKAARDFDLSVLAPKAANGVARQAYFDEDAIRSQFQKLPSHMRIRLLSIILDACLPGDIATMARTLERHLRSTRDVVSGLPDSVALKIFEKLPVQDLLRCRQVSKKWLSLAGTPDLWRSHALALTEGDPVKVQPPAEPEGWEPLVKGLFFRERNWAKGIAQRIDLFEGHTGFVTAMKLKGRKTLVTGSYDETIRVWDLSTGTTKKVLKAKAIACLDFLLDESILCAGLYDTGRVMVWDMRTGEVLQTLSGHNRGIRNVALNSDYLVSVGQDKAIVVWDWRAGNKVVRFGQQSNVSLGVSLVDHDKLVAVTVDGVIRCFSIRRKEMIGQFHLTKLGEPSLALGSRLGDLASGSAMLEWFAAHGNTMTVASKNLVVHLEWQEHVVPVFDEEPTSPSDGVRRSASSRMGISSLTSAPSSTPVHARTRRDSTQSNASHSSPAAGVRSPLGERRGAQTPIRSRKDSTASNASAASATAANGSARSKLDGIAARGPLSPTQATPVNGDSRATRIAPNLSVSPRVISILETPDMATGCVDPSKRRIVCATRFSSRAGADRRLYTSSLGFDLGKTSSQLLASSSGGAVDGEMAEPQGTTAAAEAATMAATMTAAQGPREEGGDEQAKQASVWAISGAWAAQASALQVPTRNPMAMVLDHESIVVGCQDGTVYRVGMVGSEYGLADAGAEGEGEGQDGDGGEEGKVGDATIRDLTQLREVWKEVFLPHDAPPDHPGRIRRDLVKSIGLK
ncbi:uncharacterized protein PFL1_02250 [Pseudozyma flocculosa PF-1]|uniref:uncharacterized protein n=1 Tax=Pseudozyma flocculosa PF-1 TaxID=1277687 RepID=UPI000456165B|nr:uncharacterized protein PFL1_02250 [Pseudozyma flocculosa PF-1]EPQ30133.1 hypothetical protein PFL1_02250 [Pseudozyma flocculosa PF-1]